MNKLNVLFARLCILFSMVVVGTSSVLANDAPFLGTYVNIAHITRGCKDVAARREAVETALDEIKAAGIRTVIPYANTSDGRSFYSSAVVPAPVYDDWNPLPEFICAAHERDLKVFPAICVLECGYDNPAGILEKHPEWSIRKPDGSSIGFISAAHPAARAWVVSMLAEIVEKYHPDGLLLDYMRYNNRPMRFDAESEARFISALKNESNELPAAQAQQYREETLTQLMGEVHAKIRSIDPKTKIAIYSWGPHVVENHLVSQDWKTWAERGYIDMVNVSGYCYRENNGEKYLDVLEDRMAKAVAINRELGEPIDVTICIGVVTSHGKIETADDFPRYFERARRAGIRGAAIYTWTSFRPFRDEVDLLGGLK